jgi:protein-disulfide isomerase
MALPVRPASDVAGRTEHMKGPADAPITIVEFSDFQCPHCAEAYPVLRRLIHGRPDVRLIFRHFPLDPACNNMMPAPGHPDACLAAEAAECAGRQQRFWEYHDMLFEHHETLDRDSLFRYARELGLDIPTFRTCLDDPETRARVVDDVDAGNRAGIMQTPTLFINGRTVAGTLQPAYYEYALIIEKEERDTRASRGGS